MAIVIISKTGIVIVIAAIVRAANGRSVRQPTLYNLTLSLQRSFVLYHDGSLQTALPHK